jgi:hypothetical protein
VNGRRGQHHWFWYGLAIGLLLGLALWLLNQI